MTDAHVDGQATATGDRYQALLAISEAIISHRDLSSLFHDLAGQLGRVVDFDYLALVLHDAVTSTMRLHVLETYEPVPAGTVIVLPVEEDPAGLVWQTQQPLITSHIDELKSLASIIRTSPTVWRPKLLLVATDDGPAAVRCASVHVQAAVRLRQGKPAIPAAGRQPGGGGGGKRIGISGDRGTQREAHERKGLLGRGGAHGA